MVSRLWCQALTGLLLYGGFAGAIAASEPCCNITAIDKKTGIVTAQDTKTKRVIQLKVDNAVLLNRIAINQKVDVDLAAGKASIEGTQGQFRIVSAAPSPAQHAAPGAAPRSPSAPPATDRARAPDACCAITAVNAKSGLVTARETATGRTFTFNVSDAGVLRGLRAGQPVHAHFASKQVSLDGRKPCCQIASLAAEAKPKLPSSGTAPLPGTTSGGADMNRGVPAQSGTTQGWPQSDPAAGMPSDSTPSSAQGGYGEFPASTELPSDYGSAFPSDTQGGYPADASGSGYPADAGGSGYYPPQQPGMTTGQPPQDGGKGFSYGTGEAPVQGDIPWWKQQLPQQ